MKKSNQAALSSALLSLLVGGLFLWLREGVISIAMTVMGVALLVLAIVDLAHRRTFMGVVKAVLGGFILLAGWAILSLALYVLAAVLLIWGILGLISGARRGGRAMRLLAPITAILSGACLLLAPGGTLSWVFIVSGALLLLQGRQDRPKANPLLSG